MPGTHRIQEVTRAVVIPPVPRIKLRCGVGTDLRALRAFDDHLFARRHGNGLTTGGDDGGVAAPAGDERGAPAANTHTVVARVLDREDRVRRVHFHGPSGINRAQIKGCSTLGHLDLEKIRFLVLQAELGVFPRAHESAGADLELQIPAGTRYRARRPGQAGY